MYAGSWDPPQTLGRIRRKNVAGGSAHRSPLRPQILRPKSHSGGCLGAGAPNGSPSGDLGWSPQQHSCGEAASEFVAEPQPPRPMEPNWIQRNLAPKRRDQTGGLFESCPRLKSTPPPPLVTPLVRMGSPLSHWADRYVSCKFIIMVELNMFFTFLCDQAVFQVKFEVCPAGFYSFKHTNTNFIAFKELLRETNHSQSMKVWK
ncbi:MAG: hypothetical protein GY696_05160 [Gammaproteobacteria bacterium]|nr:hypothetical protein [Gammaproteobacteria bacterium]